MLQSLSSATNSLLQVGIFVLWILLRLTLFLYYDIHNVNGFNNILKHGITNFSEILSLNNLENRSYDQDSVFVSCQQYLK